MSETFPELLRAKEARTLLKLDRTTFHVFARAHPEMCAQLAPLKRQRYRKAVILRLLEGAGTGNGAKG